MTITIRTSNSTDTDALRDLAALDSHRAPAEPVLLAEVDGDLEAAVSLADGSLVADPFKDTRTVRSLLLTRAAQLQRAA